MNFLISKPLTEIDFLSRQTMVFDSSSRTTTGTIATITPSDGQTFVLLGAHIAISNATWVDAGATRYTAELRNEANVRDTLGAGGFRTSGQPAAFGFGEMSSIVRGDILEGDGVKTYTLEILQLARITVVGTIYGYLRNT